MSLTKEHKETLHVLGTCEVWSGKCADALLRAGFILHDESLTAYRVKAIYKGFTIDGTIQLDLATVGAAEKVDIRMRVTADGGNVFSMFADPCQRIRDAFLAELWRKRKRRRD
jgi:hypothetical protein